MHEYKIIDNSWKEVIFDSNGIIPSPRHSHSGVIYQNFIYVFGGYDGLYKNDFHKFNFDTKMWNIIKDSNPSSENWPPPRYRFFFYIYL